MLNLIVIIIAGTFYNLYGDLMKYITYEEIRNAPVNKEIWACAYDEDNNYDYSHLRQEPVKGMIVYNSGGNRTGLRSNKIFMKIGRGGKLVKSSSISLLSRKYADTYEECVEVYNDIIDKRIELLKEYIEKSENDKIK